MTAPADEDGRGTAIDDALRTPDEIISKALRSSIRLLLAECTDSQRAVFEKVFPPFIYPKGIDGMPQDKLRTALTLCQRTVVKNKAVVA